MKPSIGEGSSVRPGSWTGAKAQDGSPGNLGDPAHVHVRASRQSGRRLNNDPSLEGTLNLSGAQAHAARHKPRSVAWTPEAKQISDWGCVPGRCLTMDIRVSGRRSARRNACVDAMLVILTNEENDYAGRRNLSPGHTRAPPLERGQADRSQAAAAAKTRLDDPHQAPSSQTASATWRCSIWQLTASFAVAMSSPSYRPAGLRRRNAQRCARKRPACRCGSR